MSGDYLDLDLLSEKYYNISEEFSLRQEGMELYICTDDRPECLPE